MGSCVLRETIDARVVRGLLRAFLYLSIYLSPGPATRSTTPTSDGARGMTVEAVRYTRRPSPCARADLRCKSMPAQDYSELNARVRQTWCVPRTDKPPAGPHLGTEPTTGVPDGQGQRSIQIDGLRVPCVSLQTPGDQHGLVFWSWRQARVAPIS